MGGLRKRGVFPRMLWVTPLPFPGGRTNSTQNILSSVIVLLKPGLLRNYLCVSTLLWVCKPEVKIRLALRSHLPCLVIQGLSLEPGPCHCGGLIGLQPPGTRLTCLCLPSGRMTSMCHHAQLFMWVLGIDLGSSSFCRK